MRSRSALLVLALTFAQLASTAVAAPAWFANLQLQITGIVPVGLTEEGLLADVTFEGTASGPRIRRGTVVGVDHAQFDASGSAHLNVYLTITDRDGEQISANITGLAVPMRPGKYRLQGASGIIIDGPDPHTGVLCPTTGKFAHLIDRTFRDVGFISGFTMSPPGGSVHAKWYLHDRCRD